MTFMDDISRPLPKHISEYVRPIAKDNEHHARRDGKCCPPGRGCRMHNGFQGCHMRSAYGSIDTVAAQYMHEAYINWVRTPWYRPFKRMARYSEFADWRDLANATGPYWKLPGFKMPAPRLRHKKKPCG